MVRHQHATLSIANIQANISPEAAIFSQTTRFSPVDQIYKPDVSTVFSVFATRSVFPFIYVSHIERRSVI
jgi:hypothetical protein